MVYFMLNLSTGGAQRQMLSECQSKNGHFIYNGKGSLIMEFPDVNYSVSPGIVKMFNNMKNLSKNHLSVKYSGPLSSLIGSILSFALGFEKRIYRAGGYVPLKLRTSLVVLAEVLTIILSTEVVVVTPAMLKCRRYTFGKKLRLELSDFAKKRFELLPATRLKRPLKVCAAIKLIPEKTPWHLIETVQGFEELEHSVKLDIFGEGPMFDDLNSHISSLHLHANVELKGYCQNFVEKLNEYDVFLHLSEYYEGLPQVICQALDASIPVIALDNAGVSDVVLNGVNGFVLNSFDANQVIKLLKVVGANLASFKSNTSVIPCYVDF